MKRKATALWKGTGLEGEGHLTTASGAFKNQPYSFKTRFKNDDGKLGTNPEELIAAAHAGCFTMALSFQLDRAGFHPDNLDTEAILTMEKSDGQFHILGIELIVKAQVSDIDANTFQDIANSAKDNCPVSKALANVEITLNASLA